MIPKYSVKRPYTVLVAVVLVIVLGVVSLTRMTTDLLPAMNLPYVIVVTTDVGQVRRKWKGCDIANRSGNGNDFQY